MRKIARLAIRFTGGRRTLMVRVLIVDKNSVMELGLRSLLKTHPGIEVMGRMPDGVTTADAILLGSPDVILLSDSPLDIDRVRTLAREARGARIVLLTSPAAPPVLSRAVAAGAHSCVLHGHFEPAELAEVVLATACGQSHLSGTVVSGLVAWLHGNVSMNRLPMGPGLTPREIEIMSLITDGLSNRNIADRLFISEKTVKNHVHSIYKRLGAEDRDHAIRRWRDVMFNGRAQMNS
jgi:two-component system, NarL family, nitrate/nitrite response regulator NarL